MVSVVCTHCGKVVVSSHFLGNPDLATMTGHLREEHPETALGPDPAVGTILARFSIRQVADPA